MKNFLSFSEVWRLQLVGLHLLNGGNRWWRPPFRLTGLRKFYLLRVVRLRWLDWIFWGWYLPSLSINYVDMSKDMEKRLPQLYYVKIKISYDLGFIVIGGRAFRNTTNKKYIFPTVKSTSPLLFDIFEVNYWMYYLCLSRTEDRKTCWS